MTINISIIIPCYNEAKNIPALLNMCNKALSRNDVELIVVNNGSTDNTQDILAQLAPQYPFLVVLDVPVNKGYGFGVMSGLRAAQGKFLGWTHADLQTDPEDVIKAYDLIQTQDRPEQSYAKGDRKGRPFFDQFFTTGMSLFETLFMGKKLWDINAQPNIFHRSFFEKWQANAPDDFSLDLYVLFMAKHLKLNVLRFNVFFPERIHGSSSWNDGFSSKWKFIRRTVEFSVELKKELRNDPLYRS
jgi:glycosyltransferase involved in cell wall biosynthesis